MPSPYGPGELEDGIGGGGAVDRAGGARGAECGSDGGDAGVGTLDGSRGAEAGGAGGAEGGVRDFVVERRLADDDGGCGGGGGGGGVEVDGFLDVTGGGRGFAAVGNGGGARGGISELALCAGFGVDLRKFVIDEPAAAE